MLKIFEIYLYICGGLVSLAIATGLIGLTLNLICYAYQSCIGFKKFRKIVRAYNSKQIREEDLKI